MELVKLLTLHRYSVVIFHIPVLREYWVLTESRIALQPVMGGGRGGGGGGVRIIALFISSHKQSL